MCVCVCVWWCLECVPDFTTIAETDHTRYRLHNTQLVLLSLSLYLLYMYTPIESVDQLEWHRRYCVLAKDERILYFYNDTEVIGATYR